MNEARFDVLARALGTANTRHGVTLLLAGPGLGGVLSALGTSKALAAKRKGGEPCTRNGQCKTGKCVCPESNKQCSCSKSFKACVQPAEPCREAKCAFATKLCATTRPPGLPAPKTVTIAPTTSVTGVVRAPT